MITTTTTEGSLTASPSACELPSHTNSTSSPSRHFAPSSHLWLATGVIIALNYYSGRHSGSRKVTGEHECAATSVTCHGKHLKLIEQAVVIALILYVIVTHPAVQSLYQKLIRRISASCQHIQHAFEEAQHSTSCAFEKVSSSATLTRIKSSVSASSMKLLSLAGAASKGGRDNLSGKQQQGHGASRPRTVPVVAAQEPFLRLADVSVLTLSDMKDVFRYVNQMNHPDFDMAIFCRNLRPPARTAVYAVEQATIKSRGGASTGSIPRKSLDDESVGESDALAFAVAVRLYAEWRNLRLVPERGYQRHAISMGFARSDLIQNAGKIEAAVHSWIVHHQNKQDATLKGVTTPTLRQLLQFEIDQGMHPKRPQLSEHSAASGLLWAKRQLDYQGKVFANLNHIPVAFPTATDALRAAYTSVYERYHGFIVRSMFHTSFDAFPDVSIILDCMNRPALENGSSISDDNCKQDDAYTTASSEDEAEEEEYDHYDDNAWVQLDVAEDHEVLHDESNDQRALMVNPEPNPFELLGGKLAEEFGKLQQFFSQCVGHHADPHPSRNAMNVVFPSAGSILSTSMQCMHNIHSSALSLSVPTPSPPTPLSPPSQAGNKEIPRYLGYMNGFTDGLGKLIQELNLDDPSRV